MKKTFRSELFFCFIVIALIMVVSASGLLMAVLKEKTQSDTALSATKSLKEADASLEEVIENVKKGLLRMQDEKQIIESLKVDDAWQRNKAYRIAYQLTGSLPAGSEVTVFDAFGKPIVTTATEAPAILPVYWGILKVASTHTDDFIIRNGADIESSAKPSLQIAHAIMQDDVCIGYGLVTVTEECLRGVLAENSKDFQVAILDSFWNPILRPTSPSAVDLVEKMRNYRLNNVAPKAISDQYYVFCDEMASDAYTIVFLAPKLFTKDLERTMYPVMMTLAGFGLLLCLIAAGFMSRYLTGPLNRLNEAMSMVRRGDWNVRIRSEREDELGMLSRDFDDMTRALKEYVEHREQQQQILNENSIAMMQAQLNPHFLYNTLDTIKWMAKAGETDSVATTTTSLAKLLRMTINEEKFVTLARELEILNYYVDIQRVRFEGKFIFQADVAPNLHDYQVPKLILQPIVENAIIHGLKESEDGHIIVRAYRGEKDLLIEVSDDGCGIDEATLKSLNERQYVSGKKHIGLHNVDTIIRLHYGEEYGIYVKNAPTGGCIVMVRLPSNINRNEE